MKKPICISLANSKGGVSKTTTTINLGAALARKDKNVLIVDLDYQGHATISLVGNPEDKNITLGVLNFLTAAEDQLDISEVVMETGNENLYILPNEKKIGAITVSLDRMLTQEHTGVLKRRLFKDQDFISQFDYVLFDMGPDLRAFAQHEAILASNFVISPSKRNSLDMAGISDLLDYLDALKSSTSVDLTFIGILYTMVDKREKKLGTVASELKNDAPHLFMETEIPADTKFTTLADTQSTIFKYPSSRGARAYDQLSEEVEAYIENHYSETAEHIELSPSLVSKGENHEYQI